MKDTIIGRIVENGIHRPIRFVPNYGVVTPFMTTNGDGRHIAQLAIDAGQIGEEHAKEGVDLVIEVFIGQANVTGWAVAAILKAMANAGAASCTDLNFDLMQGNRQHATGSKPSGTA